MIPTIKSRKAIINKEAASTALGILVMNAVLTNSVMTGIPISRPKVTNKIEIQLKISFWKKVQKC